MDPELKAYLDGMVETITARWSALLAPVREPVTPSGQQFGQADPPQGRCEPRADHFERRIDAVHAEFSDEFTTTDQRFRRLELRTDQLETRITYRADRLMADVQSLRDTAVRLEHRVDRLEKEVANLAARHVQFGDDVRQRFRALNERLAGT